LKEHPPKLVKEDLTYKMFHIDIEYDVTDRDDCYDTWTYVFEVYGEFPILQQPGRFRVIKRVKTKEKKRYG